VQYILRRLFQGIIICFGVSIITFLLPHLYYKPISLAIAANSIRTPHYILEKWVQAHGLNRPIWDQYISWLWGVFHGDFGISLAKGTSGVPVSTMIGGNVWRSIFLTLPPTIISICLAIPLGLTQAIKRNKTWDYSTTSFIFILYSTPAALLSILMIRYLAIQFSIGQVGIDSFAQEVSAANFPMYMIHNSSMFLLPFAAIVFLSIGGLSRYMRGSALDTLVQDYVRTARAKGASNRRVLFRHVLRPSAIPLLTILGLSLPGIFSGALIIESIFNFPGMGILSVKSVQVGDFTTVMMITLLLSVFTVLGNLLADVFLVFADPRIRLQGKR
jgi:peptide/nickel transport system permease protein